MCIRAEPCMYIQSVTLVRHLLGGVFVHVSLLLSLSRTQEDVSVFVNDASRRCGNKCVS